MKSALIFCAFGLSGLAMSQDAGLINFDHADTGFQFAYPANWTAKKSKNNTKFTFTLPDSKAPIFVEVYAVTFTQDVETWQAVQTNAAKQLKHEMVRQWQEEILTVPMLLSRTSWTEKDVAMTSDFGLIYAEGRRKFAYRLVAPTDQMDRADTAWRGVLQTIKTANSRLPKPFDPKPQSENLRRPDAEDKIFVMKRPKTDIPPAVKGDQTIESVNGNYTLILRYALPGKATANDKGVAVTVPDVAAAAQVKLYSALDSEPGGRALIKASAVTLDRFKSIGLREEKGPYRNKAGASIAYIWREGLADGGPLYTMDAVGVSGDYYWLLSWSSNDPKSAAKAHEQLILLIDSMTAEVKAGN